MQAESRSAGAPPPRPERRRTAVARAIALTVLVLVGTVSAVVVVPLADSPPVGASGPEPWTPVYNQDFADPSVLEYGGTLYSYSTETVAAITPGATSGDATTWSTVTTDIFPALPSFAEGGFTWSPSVEQAADGQFVMYYTAENPAGGDECIGRAASSSPTGPFVDDDQGFLVCQTSLGGSIDPQIFSDPGGSYLLWKSDGNRIGQPGEIWSEPLTSEFEPTGAAPSLLLSADQSWQAGIVEGPDMVDVNGSFDLFYGAAGYSTADYSIGYATCAGPSGPCTDHPSPVLTSQPGEQGPGGPSLFPFDGRMLMAFAAWPRAVGYRAGGYRAMYMASVTFNADGAPQITPFNQQGYWLAASDGGVFAYGTAAFDGSMGGAPLDRPVVGLAASPDGRGYWEVASDGGVFAFGDAGFYGSMGGRTLNRPVVGLAATPDGRGYWEVASDGGIFAFGDAGFHGSMGGRTLNKPVVGLAATPDGRGYWEVASDGGIFAFGDAGFHGSMGGTPLNRPVVGLAVDRATGGYWEVAGDGGVFAFDAGFFGSSGSETLARPVVGVAGTPDGLGYWEVASDGGIFAFGDADFEGSAGGSPLNAPVVGMAASQ